MVCARHRSRRATPRPAWRAALLATVCTAAAVAGVALLAGPGARPSRSVRLPPAAARLILLHRRPPPPRAGDWRSGPGRDERRQSFAAWRAGDPTTARGQRSWLYVQVIGAVTGRHAHLMDRTQEFLGLYFGLPVRRLAPLAVGDAWPASARRRVATGFGPQLRSTWILRSALPPHLPADGAALLGLTTYDLWPGGGWHYVFGQASLSDRVGVWSVARFGDPDAGAAAWRRCLRRTLKVATHETGHMFSMEHCRAYACNMGGSNSLPETDRQPLWLCPECLAKLWAATGVDPASRFAALADFCAEERLAAEAQHYRDSAALVAGLAARGSAPR